ncbi:CoA-transferase [Coxiella burnetii]|uniref:CoA transferase n=1 Tax=Coxiella burnetii TaxID=777 RepID=UPI00031B2DBF|nr:CoA transferase [Coxiella burnetii]AML49094.1 CoA-transferase [Coxiella burnetii]AML55031.1 CoA-transferase [Coxiella burnetii]ATN69009.1 CoA-transferase [Coxiella burnetii]ATN70928.1 CoA-transferase [Coxiella burnetii]ATN72842.1 CoA-transferase [Coxiella burnetii]
MRRALLSRYQSEVLLGPLNGVIVLGFCYYVAGPIALQNLVGQGALVIKVERKPLGDPTRYVSPPAIFNSLAHGQLSVAIDFNEEDDRKLLENLFEVVDVIVDNRSVKAKETDKLLTAYLDKPKKAHPLIYCSIDGFPDAKVNRMPGLDASAQAITGLAYTNCSSPNNPLKVGTPILDITTGLLAANYILANLYLLSQESLPPETKQVIRIAVSLAGTSVWLQANQFLDALGGRGEYFREGNRDRYAAPFSYYQTKNGLISIATVNEDQFRKFCTNVLEQPEFHQRYPTIQIRIENQAAFDQDLNQILKNKNREYWLTKCKKYDVPAAPVLTVSQAAQQNFFKGLIKSTRDGMPVVTHGAANSLFPFKRSLPAPTLNRDHNDVEAALRSKL